VWEILGFEGYSIQKRRSAKQAQQLVRLYPPDLILLLLDGGAKDRRRKALIFTIKGQ
jgi:hypothetical protein